MTAWTRRFSDRGGGQLQLAGDALHERPDPFSGSAIELGEWRGPSNFEQTHRFVSRWLWELPFGKGKRFLSGASRGADLVLGGWSVNGVYAVNTGVPFTVYDFSVEF